MIHVEISVHDPRIDYYKVLINGEDYYAPREQVIICFGGLISGDYTLETVKNFHKLQEDLFRKILGL